MTLDDVAKRIDEICNEQTRAANAAQEAFHSSMDALVAEIKASPDLDQQAAAVIALNRVNVMVQTLTDQLMK